MNIATEIRNMTQDIQAANDALDRSALVNLQADVRDLALRVGKGKVYAAFIDGMREADGEEAQW